MSLDAEGAGSPRMRNRFIFLSLAACAVFLLLALRLWYLQVVSTDTYVTLSERNRIRYIPLSAPRGPIFDRDEKLLVDNRPAFTISVLRQEVEDRDRLLQDLSPYLGLPPEDLLRRWEAGNRHPRFRPLSLADDIGREALERILENSISLPGIIAEVRPLRHYPNQDMAAHLFGYLGEIAEGELRESAADKYRLGDYVGKSGLEKRLEKFLRGTAGEKRIEVNVAGNELRLLKTQDPVPGNRVFLTIRRDLQLAAEQALGDQSGAAVALDVRTGEVLAVASRPSFNPAAFASGISGEEWIALLQNPRHPLQNKAIKGQYPPGSTFKVVTALAALRAGAATPATTVHCSGKFYLGKRDFRCWKKYGHGKVDLKKAIKESCDVWFYEVGLEVGIDRIAEAARELGLGQAVGFPLEGEKSGLIPNQKWKRERLNDRWYNGETVIAAIGQGFVLTTPVQLAVMTAAIANGGKVMRPYIIKRIENLEGEILLEPQPEEMRTGNFPDSAFKAVRAGMVAVMNEPGGTALSSRLPEVVVAGKTGTSQVIRLGDEEEEEREIPWRFRDHGLFIAFAPAGAPEIAVAVVVEHGGSGSAAAAPVARAILASYFGLAPTDQEPATAASEPEPAAMEEGD